MNRRIIFLFPNRLLLRHKLKQMALLCIIISTVLCFHMIIIETGSDISQQIHPSKTSITLFVRMTSKLEKHRTRYYCDFFRSSVLFWPSSFGKTVVVLDKESEQDHEFAKNLTRQVKQHFPDRKLELVYESLPKDESVLNFTGSPKPAGYNRQLWSSFFIDLYTDDPIVAWMDTDAAFLTPVTKSTIFEGSKLRILGSECSMKIRRDLSWAQTTQAALGLPMVADFMTYFPVYLYRDTFTHCREFILKRFNTRNFEEAFKKFYHKTPKTMLSPVNIVISFAWFFERDRYDWNLQICSDLALYNERFPSGHTISQQHTKSILSKPQTAHHVPYFNGPRLPSLLVSYCLSYRAAGFHQAICTNHSFSVTDNLVLFYHDLQHTKFTEPPCMGSNRNYCLEILERHYNQVALEITNGRRMQWSDYETVEKLANEASVTCK